MQHKPLPSKTTRSTPLRVSYALLAVAFALSFAFVHGGPQKETRPNTVRNFELKDPRAQKTVSLAGLKPSYKVPYYAGPCPVRVLSAIPVLEDGKLRGVLAEADTGAVLLVQVVGPARSRSERIVDLRDRGGGQNWGKGENK